MPSRLPQEVAIDAALVKRLLAAQFPQWRGLALRAAAGAGWDNVIYRLGEDMAVRLPRRRLAAAHVVNEHRWLPALAGRLPLAIPAVLGKGMPGEGYPWRWSVTTWLPGDVAVGGRDLDLETAAASLASFIAALRAVDPAGGPLSVLRHTLAERDRSVRDCIAALGDMPHRAAIMRAWRRAMNAPEWDGRPAWMHGDLHPANLLVTGSRLSGVIDFGLLAVGDPAVDLMVAWTFLAPPARRAFRAALRAASPVGDANPATCDATWQRGRGWALDLGLRCAAYSADNPQLREIGTRTLGQLLAADL